MINNKQGLHTTTITIMIIIGNVRLYMFSYDLWILISGAVLGYEYDDDSNYILWFILRNGITPKTNSDAFCNIEIYLDWVRLGYNYWRIDLTDCNKNNKPMNRLYIIRDTSSGSRFHLRKTWTTSYGIFYCCRLDLCSWAFFHCYVSLLRFYDSTPALLRSI